MSSRKKAENSPKKTGWTSAVSSIVSRETVASTELSETPRGSGPEPGAGGRVAEEPGRDDPVGRDREPPDAAPDERGRIGGANQSAAQLEVLQRPAVAVERDVVGREARVLPIARGEPGIVPERLRVRRQQIEGQREPPGEEVVADVFRRHAEAEDDPVVPRESLPPVVRVALELQAAPRFETQDPVRAGADGTLLRGRADRPRALRHDRGGRIGNDGREERHGLLEVDEELRRRHDVEALEVGGFPGDEAPGAADGREEPPIHRLG